MKGNKGQSLVETIVALSIAVIVITAITTVVIKALNNADYAKTQNQATQYAQEGIEQLKNFAVTNNATLAGVATGEYCWDEIFNFTAGHIKTVGSGNPTGCTTVGEIFKRTAVKSAGTVSCKDATNTNIGVKVYWSDGRCKDATNLYCHSIAVYTCSTNNYVMPSPI